MYPIGQGQKRALRGHMKTAVGIGCFVIAGVQIWLAYRILSIERSADPDKQKATRASLDRTSRVNQVVALSVVGFYLLFAAISQ